MLWPTLLLFFVLFDESATGEEILLDNIYAIIMSKSERERRREVFHSIAQIFIIDKV